MKTETFLVKEMFDFIHHVYLHWHYFIKNSTGWSVKMWENWNWLVAKHSWKVVVVQSFNLLNEHQWSKYLQIIWDYILFHSPIYKYGKKWCEKEMRIVQTVKKVQTIQKVIFVRKKKNTWTQYNSKDKNLFPINQDRIIRNKNFQIISMTLISLYHRPTLFAVSHLTPRMRMLVYPTIVLYI